MCIRKGCVVFPRYPLLTTHQPLFSALYFHTVTNPFSRNPFRFTSIQNPGGGGFCAVSRHSPLVTRHSFTQSVVCEGPLPLSFHQLAASLALPRKSTPLQSSKSRLFLQNTGGGVSRMQLRDTRGGEYLFAPHPTGLGVHTPAVPLATSRSPLLPWIP
jgi:hypothetical protein